MLVWQSLDIPCGSRHDACVNALFYSIVGLHKKKCLHIKMLLQYAAKQEFAVFDTLKRKFQKKFNYHAFMQNEMGAAQLIEEHVSTLYSNWQPLMIEAFGSKAWQHFENSKFWYGYMFTWCDLLAIAWNAEPGGTGALSGFARVLHKLKPNATGDEVQEMMEGMIHLFRSQNADTLLGANAAHMDYNRFVSNADRSPFSLMSFLEVLQKL